MTLTTSTGVVLNPTGRWAADATKYAKEKGLDNVVVFLAKHPNAYEEYVIMRHSESGKWEPIFAHTSYEAIVCRIDVLWMDKTMPE